MAITGTNSNRAAAAHCRRKLHRVRRANLGELFSVLDEKFPDLKPHLRDEPDSCAAFLNIYVK